ncbi:MAG: shikimate kinase [Candidatus Schekmanbacteria bacterium]|nr:shikimate kinase [Candidatus Schekmanbacteria bacterium]
MYKKSVVLVGFMGTGKSTVGSVLSKRLGFELIDIDALIEKKTGKSITDIFTRDGEKHFRDIEEEVIREIAGMEKAVIITGGGAVLRKNNIENLRKCGKIVCLTATPSEIYRRVKAETHRPLLQVDDPVKKIEELLSAREKFYAEADVFVDTTGLTTDEVAEEVIKKLT